MLFCLPSHLFIYYYIYKLYVQALKKLLPAHDNNVVQVKTKPSVYQAGVKFASLRMASVKIYNTTRDRETELPWEGMEWSRHAKLKG